MMEHNTREHEAKSEITKSREESKNISVSKIQSSSVVNGRSDYGVVYNAITQGSMVRPHPPSEHHESLFATREQISLSVSDAAKCVTV